MAYWVECEHRQWTEAKEVLRGGSDHQPSRWKSTIHFLTKVRWWRDQSSSLGHHFRPQAKEIFFSLDKLTLHGGAITSDEAWVKIGGYKGASSFKMNFQIVNVSNPNSVHNTCVFAVYQAPDTIHNLHVALDCYKDLFAELLKMKWRLENLNIH